ncbi:MAG: response regulator [Chitinophagaceae bacterium]|nr:response regulator [Chitinophagaceae bacterium]
MENITSEKIKLLVVDDREDNIFSIETIFERDDYIIRKATSGRNALKVLLKEFDFTLILMDVQMPELNGFETANLIYEREKLRHIPIIFITANNYDDDFIFRGYQMGAVDYIYKPINPELLRAKVGVFVELYKKNHQLILQEQKLMVINKNLEKEIKERITSEEKIKKLNMQLVENINRLRQTNEELDRFAYIASHDLQEPLRKIRTFGDRLSAKIKGIIPDDSKHYLESMLNASERMQALINDILTFSRFSSSAESFRPTNLNQVLKEVLSDLEITIEQKKAVLCIGELPTLPVIPGQIRQLFQNLITNGLKFTKEGVIPNITIHAEKVSIDEVPHFSIKNSKEDFCRITIKDNGIGFEQKFSDEIFILFKRLNTYTKYPGTGMGLSIVKKIVEKHNGIISASSKVNEGATFTIYLPYQQKETPPENTARPAFQTVQV